MPCREGGLQNPPTTPPLQNTPWAQLGSRGAQRRELNSSGGIGDALVVEEELGLAQGPGLRLGLGLELGLGLGLRRSWGWGRSRGKGWGGGWGWVWGQTLHHLLGWCSEMEESQNRSLWSAGWQAGSWPSLQRTPWGLLLSLEARDSSHLPHGPPPRRLLAEPVLLSHQCLCGVACSPRRVGLQEGSQSGPWRPQDSRGNGQGASRIWRRGIQRGGKPGSPEERGDGVWGEGVSWGGVLSGGRGKGERSRG